MLRHSNCNVYCTFQPYKRLRPNQLLRQLPLKPSAKRGFWREGHREQQQGALSRSMVILSHYWGGFLRACRTCIFSFFDLTKSLILLPAKRENFQVHWTTGEGSFNWLVGNAGSSVSYSLYEIRKKIKASIRMYQKTDYSLPSSQDQQFLFTSLSNFLVLLHCAVKNMPHQKGFSNWVNSIWD